MVLGGAHPFFNSLAVLDEISLLLYLYTPKLAIGQLYVFFLYYRKEKEDVKQL